MITTWRGIAVALSIVSSFLPFSAFASDSPSIAERHQQSLELLRQGKYSEYEALLLGMAREHDQLSQLQLGKFYLHRKDYRSAEQWLLPLAEKGDAEAQFMLGMLYTESHPSDTDKQERWFRKSAQQGHRIAQSVLERRAQAASAPFLENGEIVTSQYIDYMAETNKKFVMRTPGATACYKLTNATFPPLYDKAAATCKTSHLQRLPARFSDVQIGGNLAKSFGACITLDMLAIQKMSVEELVACTRQLRK